MVKPRLFSAMQPSADSLHLGNYGGALAQWVQLQDSHDAIFCIADLHSITVSQDPDTLASNTRMTAAQYMACGINPNLCTLFVQSHVPAHSELAWILVNLTSFGEASRMTQFKEKSQKQGPADATVGLFTYPILQAADILLYKTKVVPVGEDQRQHIELARNIAERFNHRFGDTFVLPEMKSDKTSKKVYDLQKPGSKMSKSSDSRLGVLWLLDEPEVIAKKVKAAVTDGESEIRFDPAGKPGVSNLLSILSIATETPIPDLEQKLSGLNYGALKDSVAEAVVDLFRPIRLSTREFLRDPAEIDKSLDRGREKAREMAYPVLNQVRENLGMLPSW